MRAINDFRYQSVSEENIVDEIPPGLKIFAKKKPRQSGAASH
jgi:hypothetical protein